MIFIYLGIFLSLVLAYKLSRQAPQQYISRKNQTITHLPRKTINSSWF